MEIPKPTGSGWETLKGTLRETRTEMRWGSDWEMRTAMLTETRLDWQREMPMGIRTGTPRGTHWH